MEKLKKDFKIPPNNLKNSGLILEPYREADHVVGGVTVGGLQILKPEPMIVFPNGHGWHGVVTKNEGEVQKNIHFDSFSCTCYGAAKALCKYLKYVYNDDIDILEAFLAVMAGVVPGKGAPARAPLEVLHGKGWLTEDELPSRRLTPSTTQSQFFAQFSTKQIAQAKKKLEKYDIWFDVIENSSNVSHAKIIENLKYTPVIVIGYAWASYYGNEGVFYDYNYTPNHLFIIDEHKEKDPLVDLMANDSYRFDWGIDKPDHTDLEDFVKPLAKGYKIGGAWRIYATLKGKKKTDLFNFLNTSMENLQAYMDDHGLHVWYIDPRGKQEIALTTMFEKAWAMSCVKKGIIKTTSYGAIAGLPNFIFFK